ncbi:MAG: hypothetical protein J1D87_08310 [Lachnospiraceae bacterium]|nr:hypothetical protein [Lachnospiraceae bacterium]
MDKNIRIRKISSKDIIGCLFIAISFLMLINSIRLCLSSDIWYDELFTMGMVEHSYGELINFTARDVHPPLYYIIAKFVLDLCKLIFPLADNIVIVKIVSVLPYFLLLFYAVTFLRKRFGIFVSGVFMFCILTMPQLSAYTVEMRMYGWALFFVTATFFYAYAIVCPDITDVNIDSHKDGVKHWSIGNSGIWTHRVKSYSAKNYVAIVLYGLAAAYTQYFACIAVIMVYLYLLISSIMQYKAKASINNSSGIKALKCWGICVVISIIGYLPWLFVLMAQISAIRDNYWILPLTWRSIGGCVKFLMKPVFGHEWINVAFAISLFAIYVVLLAAYGFSVLHRNKISINNNQDKIGKIPVDNKIATFFYAFSGCLVLCGLVSFGFIASIVIRPIFVYRYMLPAIGCFWLCFVLCLDNLCQKSDSVHIEHNDKKKKELFRAVSFYIIVVIILITGIIDYRVFTGEEKYRAGLMRETELAFSDIEETDIILYNFDQLQAVCGYYINQENYLWNGLPEQLITDMFGNKGSIQDVAAIKEWLSEGRTVWFFGSFNSREDIRDEWARDGIDTKEIGSYMLERYWFNIYKVQFEY